MNAIATRTMAITYAEPCDKGWLVHLPTGPRLVSDTEHAYLIAAQDAPGTVVQFSKPPQPSIAGMSQAEFEDYLARTGITAKLAEILSKQRAQTRRADEVPPASSVLQVGGRPRRKA